MLTHASLYTRFSKRHERVYSWSETPFLLQREPISVFPPAPGHVLSVVRAAPPFRWLPGSAHPSRLLRHRPRETRAGHFPCLPSAGLARPPRPHLAGPDSGLRPSRVGVTLALRPSLPRPWPRPRPSNGRDRWRTKPGTVLVTTATDGIGRLYGGAVCGAVQLPRARSPKPPETIWASREIRSPVHRDPSAPGRRCKAGHKRECLTPAAVKCAFQHVDGGGRVAV